MAQKDILVAYGIDVDAVAGWLGSYGGEDSPDDISRGLFAGEVGTPRLLKLFDKYHLTTTWYIPGHSLETFPEQMRMVVEAVVLGIVTEDFAMGGEVRRWLDDDEYLVRRRIHSDLQGFLTQAGH